MDGLRIIVMTKRSSAGGEFDAFRLGEFTFRNEEKLDFGLCAAVREDTDGVGDGVDRSDLNETGFIIAESGDRRCEVDCVRECATKKSSMPSSVLSNMVVRAVVMMRMRRIEGHAAASNETSTLFCFMNSLFTKYDNVSSCSIMIRRDSKPGR